MTRRRLAVLALGALAAAATFEAVRFVVECVAILTSGAELGDDPDA